ncbi:Aspartyl protease UND [Sesamum angolense]|uniref:Aspartyl protease UND n=2 Tax=Sesamum TaxID=4181 RepID=A0AAE2BT12_9LAMI|nr:Aspartyl protease UND [Sesamum angolense]
MRKSYIVLPSLYSSISFTFLVLLACFSTKVATKNAAANRTKLILRLIHRDSVLPALSNPNPNMSDLTNDAINSSRAHLTYIQGMSTDGSPLSQEDIRGPLVPEGRLFFINISIGEPPVPQLLALDTGSELTWLQRLPCTGCPIYEPKLSATYTELSCDPKYQCSNYSQLSGCGQESRCTYAIGYLDDSRCTGIMALEKFTFESSSGGTSEMPYFLFGYGLESHGNVRQLTGILGLQVHNQYSLVSRVGKRFSYCIGNINDPRYMYNQLIIGDGAVLQGYSTPLGFRRSHYAVTLEGISVGQKQLQIVNPEDFQFNVVIDTGSTLTLLLRSAFEPLKEEVMDYLDGFLPLVKVKDAGERPCYQGDMEQDLKGFPLVTLHLAEGADVYLDVEGMFRKANDRVFCMAVDVTKYDLNVIGILAQQYCNIGFDLNAMKVSFQRIECELLED